MRLLGEALAAEIRVAVETAVEKAVGRVLAVQERSSAWMTAEQLAEHLGMSPAAVRRAAQRGDLPSTKFPNGARRFDRAVIEQWARSEE